MLGCRVTVVQSQDFEALILRNVRSGYSMYTRDKKPGTTDRRETE